MADEFVLMSIVSGRDQGESSDDEDGSIVLKPDELVHLKPGSSSSSSFSSALGCRDESLTINLSCTPPTTAQQPDEKTNIEKPNPVDPVWIDINQHQLLRDDQFAKEGQLNKFDAMLLSEDSVQHPIQQTQLVDSSNSYSGPTSTSTSISSLHPHSPTIHHLSEVNDSASITALYPGRPSPQVQLRQIQRFLEWHKRGSDHSINFNLRRSKEFHNPDILTGLVKLCKIDQTGSNYPLHLYHPRQLERSDYYETILRVQDEYQKARMLQQKPGKRSAIDFVREMQSKKSSALLTSMESVASGVKPTDPKKTIDKNLANMDRSKAHSHWQENKRRRK